MLVYVEINVVDHFGNTITKAKLKINE